VDAAARNLRLKSGSPAIDAGANLGYASTSTVLRGPFGSAPDMGAFE
jgi:hypothetical protein